MSDSRVSIECVTCVAAGTTACADCLVSHVFANDAGPIEFLPVGLRMGGAAATHPSMSRRSAVRHAPPADPIDVAVELLQRAGLIDDATFVDADEIARLGGRPPDDQRRTPAAPRLR